MLLQIHPRIIDMQPFQIPYEPTNLTPCLTLRSRRETDKIDTTNARFVERGEQSHMDTNPIASRLHREDIQQSQPFVVSHKVESEATRLLPITLAKIQALEAQIQHATGAEAIMGLHTQINQEKELYETLLISQRQSQIDSLSMNPYFEKYDVGGDSRNIVRELRTAVTEGVVDRGVMQSQRLLERGFENRWTHGNTQGLAPIDAYDLMRPKFTDMTKRYN
jgi:hypothetical protein